MGIDELLALLQGVKATGRGTWICRCPAHDDRSPSMTVKELPDGRILIHDFGGCGTDAVLGVLGLRMSDLFPEPITHHARPQRGFSAADALRCLARESAVLAISAADQSEGKPIDKDRATVAAGRIAEALELTCGD